MELNGWASPQMLRRYGASARGARARRTYDRIMTDTCENSLRPRQRSRDEARQILPPGPRIPDDAPQGPGLGQPRR